MNPDADSTSGGRSGLRQVGEAFCGLVRCRLELFALELQEEKERLLWLVVRLAVFVAVGAGGLLLVLGLVAWLAYRWLGVWGIAAVAAFCLGTAAWGVRKLIRDIRRAPAPFHQTVTEFKKDRAWLRPAD